MSAQSLALSGLTFALLSDWFTTFSLVFGGCCSNALTLERVTSQYPNAGTLITFCQFLVISIHGLPRFLTFCRGPLGIPFPCLKTRRIPLTPYVIQVALFYLISLLNNAAFAYAIPMPVHIIFRSGGLVISMLMGWLISKRRYTLGQVASVLLVTLGVVLTTLSASYPTPVAPSPTSILNDGPPLRIYLTGIAILTLALILSGLLGVVQDRTYARYGNRTSPPPTTANSTPAKPTPHDTRPDTWEESMFYLHFLALPLFLSVRADFTAQARALLAAPRVLLPLPLPPFLSGNLPQQIEIPAPALPLALNTLTQLLCVAGVNRLTTRVAALTVTLVLVVRKAASLVLSVLLFGAWGNALLWAGAALVGLGTVGYALAGPRKVQVREEKKVQ